MRPSRCMQLLGLDQTADLAQIKRAYRQLAKQTHPDKHPEDQTAHKRFAEISTAYHTLVRATRAVEKGKHVGICRQCLRFGEVNVGIDGGARCPRSALRGTRGLLPLPAFVVTRCIGACLLLGLAAWLLTASISTGKSTYAAAAFLVGVLSLSALAYTCITVVHCFTRQDRLTQKRHGNQSPNT